MNLTFANGTARQQQWVHDAIGFCRFDFSALGDSVAVHFVAPDALPVAGHQDYMCTVGGGGSYDIYIRNDADDVNSPAVQGVPGGPTLDNVKLFYMESVIHEFGHVVSFDRIVTDAQKSTAGADFTHSPTGDGTGTRTGTLADWNPTASPWAERLQEGVAEAFKMSYMPPRYRAFDNRSNWNLTNADIVELLQLQGTGSSVGALADYIVTGSLDASSYFGPGDVSSVAFAASRWGSGAPSPPDIQGFGVVPRVTHNGLVSQRPYFFFGAINTVGVPTLADLFYHPAMGGDGWQFPAPDSSIGGDNVIFLGGFGAQMSPYLGQSNDYQGGPSWILEHAVDGFAQGHQFVTPVDQMIGFGLEWRMNDAITFSIVRTLADAVGHWLVWGWALTPTTDFIAHNLNDHWSAEYLVPPTPAQPPQPPDPPGLGLGTPAWGHLRFADLAQVH